MNPLFLDFKMKTAAGTQLWAKTGNNSGGCTSLDTI